MKPDEIELLKSKHNAAIIAPAGHGKTEMIAELVEQLAGKKLILTHTNAGVSALTQRLNKKKVNKEKYSLLTISSFCMKWCEAYPVSSGTDRTISVSDTRFYKEQTRGAINIFSHSWARDIIRATYTCLIIDEYQDCVLEQHQVFLQINKSVPVYVFGDPLQSIFGWAGKPVSWSNIEFDIVPIETFPYRWMNTNVDLGQYLTEIRKTLLPALKKKKVRLSTLPNGDYLKRITPAEAHGTALISEMNCFQSALYITKWPKAQCAFSQKTGGLFQNDEPQNMSELYTFAHELDTEDGLIRAKTIYSFIEACATHVNSELGSYKKHLKEGDFRFDLITKHVEFGNRMLNLYQNPGYSEMISVLEWIKSNPAFRLYRLEMFNELIHSIRFAKDNEITICEAAKQIRMNPNKKNKYCGFNKLSSRTVLSKGLEFECVAINLEERFTATEMYVAMTRATKEIIFITDKDSIVLDFPQGL